MKPLLRTVVAISLLLAVLAHPENIEDVKGLPQTKEPIIEAEESEPQARVERCTTCGTQNLKVKSPKEFLAALQSLPGSEVHTQQSFEGCSTDKGCHGVKVKDGQVIQRYGNSNAFKAAEAADISNEFNFLTAGALAANPFWWMNQNGPFKNGGNFEKFSKSSFTSSSGGNAELSGALNLAANPFLNGDFANNFAGAANGKPSSSFQSSSYESSYSSKGGDLDLSKNPFLNGGFKAGAIGAGQNAGFAGSNFATADFAQSGSSFGAQGAASNFGTQGGASNFGAQGAASNFGAQGAASNFGAQGGASNFGAQGGASNFGAQGGASNFGAQGAASNFGAQGGASNFGAQGAASNFGTQGSSSFNAQSASNFGASSAFGGSNYAGSTPRPFGTTGSNVNLVQTAQKASEFDFSQQTQQNIDELFQGGGNVEATGGDLQQTCAGQGYICVPRAQCSNGVVINNGANILQANTKKQYCSISTEICCRLEASSLNSQSSFAGQGSLFQSSSSANANAFRGTAGANVGAVVPTLAPVPSPNFIETDSFSAGSETAGVYRPGAIGSVLKPGIPYLPPVDSTNSGSNLIPTTAFPPPIITTPRPFTTPKPFIPVSSTSAPGYLPPIGEQTINRETIVPPNPNYIEGSLILDENRNPRPKSTPSPVPLSPNDIPAGCAAALKCTPVEFCTAEGVISNTSVILTRDQDAYRVPLTDCRDLETGRIGKCCRDPFYTDPWPTNQLGKWVPGVFGGNDGKYVPDSKGSANNVRPVTPPTTGSVIFGNFRTTPKPTVPSFGSNPVSRFPTTVTPVVSRPGVGQFSKGGQGQFTKGGQGQYGLGGRGQVGLGSRGQVGLGTQGQVGVAGQGQFSQVGKGQVGIGSQGQIGRGQIGVIGQADATQLGVGQIGVAGQGQFGQVGRGQVGIGTQSQFGRGQGSVVGQGEATQLGVGQIGVSGQGQYGQVGRGQIGVGGQGQFSQVGRGQIGVVGQGEATQLGIGQIGVAGQGIGQVGRGQIGVSGQGISTQLGVGQIGVGGQGVVGRGQVGVGQTVGVGQSQQGIGQVAGQGQVSQFGRGQVGVVGQGQNTQLGIGQVGRGQSGVGQISQVGLGQQGQVGIGQVGIGGQGQYSQVGRGQVGVAGQGIGQVGRGQVAGQGQFGTGAGQGTQLGVGQIGVVDQGENTLLGNGQIGVAGQGQYSQVGRGQIGVGGAGQLGAGSQVANAFSRGQGQVGGQGQIASQGQGLFGSQGQGELVSQGQGQLVSQGEGQIVSQGQGQYGVGGQGQFGVGGQGQFGVGGQGQFGVGEQGQFGVGGQGQQGFGIISQANGLSKASGQLISQAQGQKVSQEKGQVVSQGKGQITSQGQGQYITSGQGTIVTQGGGSYVSQGEGQTVSQGFGTGIRQGQGFSVSKGSGIGVENEYGESVQRVFLQRYNGAGQCGILNPQRPYGNKDDLEVDFAEIPWQAMVLLQTNRSLLCGGVITRPDVVVTSAACVEGLEAKNVLIKGGEWKLGIDDEPLPFQIVQVKTILRHPLYRSGSLLYDAAVLVLSENLRLSKNIYPICLPSSSDSVEPLYNGIGECIVTGWGKIVLQAHLEGAIMHSLNVSLINPGECQAKLSSDYPHLLEQYSEDSCVCGQPTNPLNNICKVDIGSALACTNGNGRYVMQGVYSWDSGCQVGNQIASFYKFDLEWYEWSIGLIESVRFSQFTQITTGKISGQVKGSGVKTTQFGTGVKTTQFGTGVKTTQFGTGIKTSQFGGANGQASSGSGGYSGVKGFAVSGNKQFGFEGTGQAQNQGQFSTGQLSQFASGKFGSGQVGFDTSGFNTQLKTPISSNTYSATYSEKKIFQTEPKIVTYTTKPEIVTFTTKPEIFTYTTKPKIITYTTKPKIITYTTKPQIITYETSGSGTNPQYVAPGITFNPSFSDLVGHKHNSQCKCIENK